MEGSICRVHWQCTGDTRVKTIATPTIPIGSGPKGHSAAAYEAAKARLERKFGGETASDSNAPEVYHEL